MEKPYVSILTSVFNGEAYLRETLNSILAQTYENWECIIVDDCSSDHTPHILSEYQKADTRFQIFRNQENMRLPASLNRVIPFARGKYIVRMDADDINRFDRIEKQVAFMEDNPHLTMSCGRWFNLEGTSVYPVAALRRCAPEMIRGLFLFFNPVGHHSVIIKTERLQDSLYNPRFSYTEDLDLWTRILKDGGKIAVQNEFLLLYRVHENQVTTKYRSVQQKQYQEIIASLYAALLQPLEEKQLEFLTERIYYRNRFQPSDFGEFVREIAGQARRKQSFTREAVRYAAFEVLMTRRSLAEDKKALCLELLRLGPVFLFRELLRRTMTKKRQREICKNALEQFCAQQKTAYTMDPRYWNV